MFVHTRYGTRTVVVILLHEMDKGESGQDKQFWILIDLADIILCMCA